jgi:polyhydroxybutyrate depolymerase
MRARYTGWLTLIASMTAWVPTMNHAQEGQTLQVGGVTRTYTLRTPERLPEGARVPLVLVFHGGGGNAGNAERMTGFTDKARQEGFIVVYPEGSGRLQRGLHTWNAGHCCGYAMTQKVDDVGFISALIDALAKTYPIDEKRVYATGMSNGGMMAHRLGIDLSVRIAAIAPVVATVFGDERKPEKPVAALMINGLLDKNVPVAGGAPGGPGRNAWDGTPAKPALDQGVFWAKANECAVAAAKEDTGTKTHWRYRCPAGRAVEVLVVKDSGHAWPGGQSGRRQGDTPSASLAATNLIWEFFAANHRAVR